MDAAAPPRRWKNHLLMPPAVIDIRSADDSRDVVHRAVQALAEGRLVALPTETVYGLAASALNAEAVARLLEVKGRAGGKALTLAIRSADDLLDYLARTQPIGPAAGAPMLARSGDDCRRKPASRKLAAPTSNQRATGNCPQQNARAARAGASAGARHSPHARRAGRADQRQSGGPARSGERRSGNRRRWATRSNWCSTTAKAAWASPRPWSRSGPTS